MTDNPLMQIQLDRAAVDELVHSFALAIDRRDWDLYRSLYGATLEIDYRPEKPGMPQGTIPSEAWTQGAKASLGALEATQHNLNPARIRIDGDRAKADVYFQAHHYDTRRPGDSVFTEHGIYVFTCARDGDAW